MNFGEFLTVEHGKITAIPFQSNKDIPIESKKDVTNDGEDKVGAKM